MADHVHNFEYVGGSIMIPGDDKYTDTFMCKCYESIEVLSSEPLHIAIANSNGAVIGAPWKISIKQRTTR